MSDAYDRSRDDDARRAAERAAGAALDGDEPGIGPEPTALSGDARRVWTEHLFVHGLLRGLHEAESNADARESRVEAVMSRVRDEAPRRATPWLHYAAAAAVLAFLVIGGLQFFGRRDAPTVTPLEAAFTSLSADVDLEYVGDVAFEYSDRPLESHESTFITGPNRFYVRTKVPIPFGAGRMPFEFGALGERRWIKMMGFPVDVSRLEGRMARHGMPRRSRMFGGEEDPLRLVTDLGALLARIRETCDAEFSKGGLSKDGEPLTVVRGTPRDPDASGLESIEVRVGERTGTVESFMIVMIPPAVSATEDAPGMRSMRRRFGRTLRDRTGRAALQRVTLSFRLVRTFDAPRETFLPAALDR